MSMKLKVLDKTFSVCKIADIANINRLKQYMFLAISDEEVSLICPEDNVPENVLVRENGWRCFRFDGVLDFSLVGVLAKVLTLLADAGIQILAVSTYNTDYIFTKEDVFDDAIIVLKKEGYVFL